jgi:hypothetical protein
MRKAVALPRAKIAVSKIAVSMIAAIMLTAPSSARERTYCSTYSYQSPSDFYTCKDVCKNILQGRTPDVRVAIWQSNMRSVHVTKVSGRDIVPLASDVTSCEGTNSAGYAPNGWQPCTMRICVTADLPVQPRSDQAHMARPTIPPLRVVPKPKVGPPPQPLLSATGSSAGTNRALGAGLLDGDGGFTRAGPAAAGSPLGGSAGSATITSTGGSGGLSRGSNSGTR